MVSEDDMRKKVNIHAEILRKTSLTTHSLNPLYIILSVQNFINFVQPTAGIYRLKFLFYSSVARKEPSGEGNLHLLSYLEPSMRFF